MTAKLQSITVQLSDLNLDPANARKHNKKNLAAIKASLTSFGQVEPLVVRKATKTVIGGNGRLEAMRDLGWTECAIVEVDLDSTQATALGVALNRTSELAEWNEDTLGKLLHGLREDGLDLGDLGFELKDLEEIKMENASGSSITEENQDVVPEVKESFVKRGEIWQLGAHRLMCGDSTSKEDVEKLMGGERADITFTSPPYNAGVSAKLRGNSNIDDNLYGDGYDDNKTHDEWLLFVSNCTKLSLEFSRYQFWNIQFLAGNRTALPRYWAEFKENVVDVAIWNKGHGAPQQAARVMNSAFEFVFVFTSDKKPSMAIRCAPEFRGNIQNVFDIPPQRNNEFASVHAETFPVAFPEAFIEKFAPKQGSCLELFAGTGTTIIACEKTGRKCFGMEIDQHYCSVIVKRWQDATGKTAVKLG